MACLVEVQGPVAEAFGSNACLTATTTSSSLCLVVIFVVLVFAAVGVAIFLDWLNEPIPRSCETVAEHLERSAQLVRSNVEPVQIQASTIRKATQKRVDQAVKQTIEDIEKIINKEINI